MNRVLIINLGDNNVFLKKIILFIVFNFVFLNTISAHEMWLEPLDFTISPKQRILAHEKVGQDFKGNTYSYLSSSYVTLDLLLNNQKHVIDARLGDIPAVSLPPQKQGLAILAAETTASSLTYKEWKKFESFVQSKGLDWVISAHKKRALPESGFTELYRRYAKALVKIGNGKGSDKRIGWDFEWVMETNPYTTADMKNIRARLYWNGKPFPNAHVSVFNRKDKALIKTELTTDKNGRVEIPRANGGRFMINSVQMIQPSKQLASMTGAVWESLWASMTYAIE